MDRLSDRLEGFTGQIWNLPEISGNPASLAISASTLKDTFKIPSNQIIAEFMIFYIYHYTVSTCDNIYPKNQYNM